MHIVDVEDVALAHVRALERSGKTRNQRYLLIENSYWMKDVVDILKDQFESYGYISYNMKVPNFMVHIGSLFLSFLKPMTYALGRRIIFDNSNVRTDLGISFIHHYKTINKCASSLIKHKWLTK